MIFLGSAIRKDLWRRSRDPWSLLLWLGIPLMIGLLFTFILGGQGGVRPVAKLLLADEDQSLISSLAAGFFEQGQMRDLIDLERVDRVLGESEMADGKASALLIIPKGFGDAVLYQKPAELQVITNPAQRILPGIILEGVTLLADGTFYIHQVFGEELKIIAESLQIFNQNPANLNPEALSMLSPAIAQKMQIIAQVLFPPRIGIEAVVQPAQESAVEISYGMLFFPGILMMAVLFAAQGLSSDFWEEREQGTLRRYLSTPQALGFFVLAKVVMTIVVMSAVLLFLMALGFWHHGIGVAKLPVALVWLVVAGVVFCGLMAVTQLFLPTHRAASLITSLVTFPLLMIGGSFFPFEAMPGWMAAIGKWTPNGLVLENVKKYLYGRSELSETWLALLMIFGTGVLLWALILWRSHSFARGGSS